VKKDSTFIPENHKNTKTLQGINGNFKVGKERTYRAVIRQVVPLRKVQSHLIKGLKSLLSMVGDAPVAAPLHTSPLVFH
jgi:hypothetical protein